MTDNSVTIEKKGRGSLLLITTFALFLFSLTRVYRNSFDYNNPTVGGIWNFIVIGFCVASAIVFIFSSFKMKREYAIIMALSYGAIAFLNNVFRIEATISSLFNTLMILAFPLLLFFFYYVFFNSSSKHFRVFFICFYYLLLALIAVTNIMRLTGQLSYIMISNVYYLLCLFPVAMYVCKKKTLLVILTFIPVITSEKRVALIAFVVALFVYVLSKAFIQKDFKKTAINLGISALIIAVFLLLLSIFETVFNVRIISRLLNLSNDQGSGRADMYRNIVQAFDNSSLFEKVFGHGIDTSKNVLIIHDDVHDDFLQILYEYGFLPFVFLVFFYLSLLWKTIRGVFTKSEMSPFLSSTLAISGLLSLFSVFITDYTYSVCMAFTLGYLLALDNGILRRHPTSYGFNR